MIPAGPLRAPLDTQMTRAQALVVIGPADRVAPLLDIARRYEVKIFHGRLEPERRALAGVGPRKVLAIAGIGNPEKFFATLAEAGVEVADRASFPDHYRYRAADARRLLERADAANLVLLTTEKDLARLTGDPRLAALAARANALPVRLVIDEHDAFRDMIVAAVKRR
jgi:tetraacyldisaccharide 4'-kinase